MAKRQVVWTQTADIQLTIVLEYWVNRTQSVTFSRKLLSKVTERTLQIAEKPQMYRKAGLENIRVASSGFSSGDSIGVLVAGIEYTGNRNNSQFLNSDFNLTGDNYNQLGFDIARGIDLGFSWSRTKTIILD